MQIVAPIFLLGADSIFLFAQTPPPSCRHRRHRRHRLKGFFFLGGGGSIPIWNTSLFLGLHARVRDAVHQSTPYPTPSPPKKIYIGATIRIGQEIDVMYYMYLTDQV